MISWLSIAIIGHLLNAVAFIVDKALLSTAFKRSGTYAVLIGGLSSVVLIALPWTTAPPVEALVPIFGFGALFVLAIWLFFEALSHAEASRVVPVIGSLVPVFTLSITSILIGERLSVNGYFGFALLVLATGVLSYGKRGERLAAKTALVCILSAFLFASSSALGKISFQQTVFLDVFVWSRFAAIFVSGLIAFYAPGVKAELVKLSRPKTHSKVEQETNALAYMLFGQFCGAIGFVLLQFAISQGSASIVNALQAIQYVILILVAWFGGTYLRQVLREHVSMRIVIVKSIAICFVAVGLYLVSH